MEHSSIPSPRSPESPQGGSFLERMRALAEAQATVGERLYNLYEREGGNTDAFSDAVDDVVFDIAFKDEEYAENAAKLKGGNLKEEVAKRIAEQQRAMVAEIRRMVLMEARIPTEEMMSDIERGQAAVVERLAGLDMSQTDSDEVLRRLGILADDKEGKAVFTFPRDLFPESVAEKWDAYMTSVKNHITVGRDVGGGMRPREDLEAADAMRRFAHNSVTSDVHKILGLDKLPEEEWDFESTRRMIAKMRDAKFGGGTSEAIVTSKALARGMGAISLNVVSKLASRGN